MIRRFHGGIGFGNFAVRADQHRDPARPGRIGCCSAIGDRHCLGFIAQQIVGEAELVPERLVGGNRIAANADDRGIQFLEVLDSITESVSFDGSPRCIGFRIPPEQGVATREIVERDGLSVLIAH